MFKRKGSGLPSLRRALLVLPIWSFCVVWMLHWWLTTDLVRYMYLFIPLTLALFYEFAVLPSVFLYFVIKAKKPARKIAPKGKKVAVISLCVPSSESLDIVENQLKAMAAITYPHDSWILDEGNDREIKKLAKKYGVNHFSRKGKLKYNQPIPPFKEKTKAGNVNAWLNHVKRRKYEYFVQLDIDHIPNPNYLHKTLGYFKDENVAWVQAPSVYGNLDSWAARGAAERELVLQGPLQMGFYGHSETPFIIGSHCTYRMSAIREIGGFQPTRAEDHLDTVHLAHNGYKGVFLPEIIAVGDGPETLNTYLSQQFAWAYSMFQVLLGHTPKLLKTMSFKRRWQFLFAQTWYPLWSVSYLVMFMTPIIALYLKRDVVSADPRQMLLHFAPLYICGFLVWLTARPIMQPRNLSLSWRGVILHAITWPIILRAIIAVIFKIKKPYMITPKGSFAKSAPNLATYRPFLIFGLISAGSIVITNLLNDGKVPISQAVFAITNAIFMLSVCLVDISIRAYNSRPKLAEIKDFWVKPVFATLTLVTMLGLAFVTVTLSIPKQFTYAQEPIAVPAVNKHVPRKVNFEMSTEELIEQISFIEKRNNSTPNLGMYDPLAKPVKSRVPYIQHSFSDWNNTHDFAFFIAQSLQNGNVPLVTIEPRGEQDGVKLLANITEGSYDNTLSQLSRVIKASKNPVFVRFAHEMELSDLYPWGNQDSSEYINAYRHFYDYLRTNGATNVRSVWAPAGNIGAEKYYPGDEYVDAIGVTVLYDEYWYGNLLPTFEDLTETRLRLQSFNKPMWIVEFGVGNANPTNQAAIISEAKSKYKEEGFEALIYLNIADSNISGPDYRLSSSDIFSL